MELISHNVAKDQEVAAKLLAEVEQEKDTPTLEIKLSGKESGFELSEEGSALFLKVLSFLVDEKPLKLMSSNVKIDVAQAAGILNVSTDYVFQLIEEGKLKSEKLTDFYFLELDNVLAYDKKMRTIRDEGLAFLTAQAQELNLGY